MLKNVFFTRKYLNGIFHLLNELWIHAAMSKVIHHDQMSSLSSANNQQLMKTNSKFQITEQNNISIETINDLFFLQWLLVWSFPSAYSWCLSLSQDQETTWFGVYIYLSNFEEKRRLLYSRSAIPLRPRTSIFNIYLHSSSNLVYVKNVTT